MRCVFLLVFILSACVSANDPVNVAESIRIENNPHTGLRTYRTGRVAINQNLLAGTYILRSSVPLGQSIEQADHQLYFSVTTSSWMFIDSAYSEGKKYPLLQISKEVVSCGKYDCTLAEDVAIKLTLEQLEDFSSRGYIVQLTGKQGRRVVAIPAAFFQGYLSGARQI